MRKVILSMLIGALCVVPASAAVGYVRGEAAWNKTTMDSGGRNLAGDFNNTGDDDDSVMSYGLGMGVKTGRWRFGLDVASHEEYEFTTNSFEPPNPTFFYNTKLTMTTIMVSGNWEILSKGRFIPFIGLNAGMALLDADTDDTVVSGDENTSEFVWGADAGLSIQITNRNFVELGYRYVDVDEMSINLDSGVSGQLTADLSTHQLFAGWRFSFK